MSENTNLIPRTNREFLGYIDKKTEHIYMISEFIDNSIQSFIDSKRDSVKVSIIINMKEEAIYIIDNAAGIPYKNRASAIKNGKDEAEQGNSLNMFGVGMKMAAIWFGRRLSIFTKSDEDNFSYKICLDVDKLKGEEFYFTDKKNIDIKKELKIDFLYQTGTIIKIDKLHFKTIHKNRYDAKFYKKGSKSEGRSLEDQLACRYSRFLKDDRLVISISYIDKLGEENMPDHRPVEITNSKIPNLYIGKYNDRNDYEYGSQNKNINQTKHFNEEFNRIKKNYELEMNENVGFFEGLTYKEIFDKFEKQEEFKFNCSFVMHEYPKTKIPFTFGFVGKNNAFLKYSGLSVYQDDRAIVAGPNSKNTTLTWLLFDKSFTGKSFRVNKRFIGEIDLHDKKIFRVDNNKQGFHGNLKEEIESYIIEKFRETKLDSLFTDLLELIFSKEDEEKSQKELNEDIKRYTNELNKNRVLDDNFSASVEELELKNKDGDDITVAGIKIFNEERNETLFSFVCTIVPFKDDNKKIFKPLNQEIEKETILVLLVNKNFYGFKPNIKDDDFSTLINPITNLILFALKECKNNKERVTKFYDLIGGLENGK